MTRSITSDVYLDFLCLRRSLREASSLPALDPLEERLVEMIAGASEPGERFSVSELINSHELGSPTTLHTRLTSLRAKGWIELAYTDGARTRQLQLTTDGLRYMDKLAKCMMTAAQ
jgi:hypothetical protein